MRPLSLQPSWGLPTFGILTRKNTDQAHDTGMLKLLIELQDYNIHSILKQVLLTSFCQCTTAFLR